MATFEKLMRDDLMAAVHAALPAIALDAANEPNQARVLITERKFDYSNPRKYKVGDSLDGKQLVMANVYADVTRVAVLELHSKEQLDLDAFVAALINNDSPVWTWRTYSTNIDRTLTGTTLEDTPAGLVEKIMVEYTAPIFHIEGLPVIKDESYFDGWQFGMPTIPEDEDEEPEE